MQTHGAACLIRILSCAWLVSGGYLHALEVRGLIDLRLGATDADRSLTRDGLDKTRFDRDSGSIRLGQLFCGSRASCPIA